MRIAVVGWGSLIWCPGSLRIRSRWSVDGPMLPIEFGRISGRYRVTLVIMPGAAPQQTFWGLSEFSSLSDAAENLRDREGTSRKYVHCLAADAEAEGLDAKVAEIVRRWLEERADLDAVVWTGLPSNWLEKREHNFTRDDVLAYLGELRQADKAGGAEEYVRNTPASIRTEVRERIEAEFGWTATRLAPFLFEDRS